MPEVFNFEDSSAFFDIEAVTECFIGDISAAAENNRLAEMVEGFDSAITAAQLAKILQCSRREIYKLVDQKRIPALKVGTMIRLDPGQVGEWLRSKMTVI